MLNRRHLRIKVLQALYAYTQSDNQNYAAGEKEFLNSIDKMYDLYVLYLLILPELKRFANRQIEERKRKVRATDQDLNPPTNFVNNKFIDKLNENDMLNEKSAQLKLDWVGDVQQDLLKKLFLHIQSTELYTNFIAKENPTFEEDKNFSIKLFKKEICNYGILLNYFEEQRIHWQDDFDHVFSMSIKLMKSIKEDTEPDFRIPELYKDDEEEFATKLFRKSVANFTEHSDLLASYTKNWEKDRLAKMDIFIMNLAITEATEFPSIPLKVSMNEYIEISKFYSTPKSNTFINGVLDKLFSELVKKGEIKKIGRGLV